MKLLWGGGVMWCGVVVGSVATSAPLLCSIAAHVASVTCQAC